VSCAGDELHLCGQRAEPARCSILIVMTLFRRIRRREGGAWACGVGALTLGAHKIAVFGDQQAELKARS
jgi:hypothetical protein